MPLSHSQSPGAEQQRRRESSPGTTPAVQLHIPAAVSLHGAAPPVSSTSRHKHARDTGVVQPRAEPQHLPALDKK